VQCFGLHNAVGKLHGPAASPSSTSVSSTSVCLYLLRAANQGLSKGIIEHLVGVLKSAPRPLRHPSLAALLEDPVNSSSIINSGIAARARLSSCGGARTYSAAGSSAAYRVSSSTGVMMQAAGAGCGSAAGKGLSVVVKGVAVSVPSASHVPPPKWLLGQEEEEQSAEGGQLLLMMVGDQNLANLRRAMDQQVGCRGVGRLAVCVACQLLVLREVSRAGGAAAHIICNSMTCTLMLHTCSCTYVRPLGD
jgi:hypothetical protein